MFSMFSLTRVPQKWISQTRKCQTTAQHFLACKEFRMACCDIQILQHDILWSAGAVGHPAKCEL